MTAIRIDGREIAARVEAEVAARAADLVARGIQPGLATVRVGNDPASEVYVRSKGRKARELGFHSEGIELPADVDEAQLLAVIERLNRDPRIDGILVQLPLPRHIDPARVIRAIDPEKDVDGFHPTSVGRLHLGQPTLVPCTPAGVMRMLDEIGTELEGKHAVVVGRSDIVGKPMAALLLQRNATVTICHSRTRDLPSIVRQGDVVVAAVGRPYFVSAAMIREGATVIDVGINRLDRGPASEAMVAHDPVKAKLLLEKGTVLVGDVDYLPVAERAAAITPVPGGVGPLTIAMLMANTVTAAGRSRA